MNRTTDTSGGRFGYGRFAFNRGRPRRRDRRPGDFEEVWHEALFKPGTGRRAPFTPRFVKFISAMDTTKWYIVRSRSVRLRR